MSISPGFKEGVRFNHAFIVFVVYIFLYVVSTAAAGDLMGTVCNNQVVSVGDREGVVLAKCGKPLSKSKDTAETQTSQTIRKKKSHKKQSDKDSITTKKKAVKKHEETWTYNIDGSYRFFIFEDGKLSRIETGGLVN